MATFETSRLPEISETTIPVSESSAGQWEASAVAADIVTMGTGTLVASLFNVALVFIVPKLISIEDYGYWRLFLLYASYAGVLHLGLVDGALLKWAGKPLDDFRDEINPLIKFLIYQNLIVILLLSAFVVLIRTSNLRFVAFSVLGVSLIQNLTTLFQIALQAGRQFRPVAISAAAPLGLLLFFLLAGKAFSHPSYRGIIIFYVAGWILTLACLTRTVRRSRALNALPMLGFGISFISAGWPIVLGNASLAFAQQLDRFAVSWVANIQDFAMYSLAASAVAVPMLIVQAVYKVIFSHLAGIGSNSRILIFSRASRLLLLAWIVLLPYYFVLEVFVAKLLPRYLPSLPIAEILLMGTVFLASVQILHMSFSYLYGRQRQFLIRTLEMLALGLALAVFAALVLHSLAAVAVAEVGAMGVWWLLNEWDMRDLTGQSVRDWIRFLAIVCLAGLGYGFAAWYSRSPMVSGVIYCGWAAVIVVLFCRSELRLVVDVTNHLSRSNADQTFIHNGYLR